MDTNIEVFLGATLIVIYAIERFNTPSNVRASTTAGRYFMAIFLYLLIYLVTFLVFTNYPHIAGSLKEHLAANDINVDWILVGFFDQLIFEKDPVQLFKKIKNHSSTYTPKWL